MTSIRANGTNQADWPTGIYISAGKSAASLHPWCLEATPRGSERRIHEVGDDGDGDGGDGGGGRDRWNHQCKLGEKSSRLDNRDRYTTRLLSLFSSLLLHYPAKQTRL